MMKKIMGLILLLLLAGCQNKLPTSSVDIVVSPKTEALISHVDKMNNVIQVIQPENMDTYWQFLKENQIMIPTKFFNGIDAKNIRKAYIMQDEKGTIMASHQFYQSGDVSNYLEMQIYFNATEQYLKKPQIEKVNAFEVRYALLEDTHRLHASAIEFLAGSHNIVLKASYYNGEEVGKNEVDPKKYTQAMFKEIVESLQLIP